MNQHHTFPSGGPSPIADLSYRNYDGATRSRALRWWIVALSVLRTIRRKPIFWILLALALFPYLFSGVTLYIKSNTGMMALPEDHAFAAQFHTSLQSQEFWIFLTALVVGADCIAGDLRANALLIYLSKPIAKGDYLLGKWMGVFLPLYLIALAPATLLFICSAFGMFGADFLKNEPTLFPRMLLATAIPALVHTSILVGFSAWSKSGRIAGAAYAGFCLLTTVISGIMGGLQMRSHHVSSVLIQHLSVTGVIGGIAQSIYNVKTQANPFAMQMAEALPPAFKWEMLGIGVALCVIGIVMARVRINAVEVVRG